MNFRWTDELVSRVASLWADDLSQSEIAAKIGVTRNMIAGLANRNRDIMPARTKTGRPMTTSPRRERVAKLSVVASVEETSAVDPNEYDHARIQHAKLLHETGDHECKWALTGKGPYLFCAETTIPGKSWCSHHAQRVVGAGTISERNAVREERYIGKVAA